MKLLFSYILAFMSMILILIVVINPVTAAVDYSNISTVTKDGLEFTVKTDKKDYNENELVRINWSAINVGAETISFVKQSTCHDGFTFQLFDSDLKKVYRLLSENALLISKNDPRLNKFDSKQFYGDILQLIEKDPEQEHAITIMTSDKNAVEDFLLKLGITKINKAQNLSFVVAQVPVKEIPKIADYKLVRSIIDGETPVCGAAEVVGVLELGDSIEGNFSWSQLIQSTEKEQSPYRVAGGYYSIDVKFNNISNCIIISILNDDSFSSTEKIPCGLISLPSSLSKEEIIEFYRNISVNTTIFKSGGFVFDPIVVNQIAEISTNITNNENIVLPFVYQLTMHDPNGEIVYGPHAVATSLEPGQTLNSITSWIPDVAGTHTVKILVGNELDNLSESNTFNIIVEEISKKPVLPYWIKQNAHWWADGQIDDDTFVLGIEYMINQKIIEIDDLPHSTGSSETEIPDWIKSNARWWFENRISEGDFINGIKYLSENGIINIANK